ncbi:leader peptidase (prepilin peptidase)/N-methyltransferase [Leifsonia sp. 563]|uniref:prepilin peptidase n=1 Tax=Leifsonia sp. 563 TaxID=3156412 RepID=UPI003395E025
MPVVVLGLFGSLIGSFLNVVIFRVPAGRSIVAPPSACGSCGARIRGYDNIPVVSWLVLRGRCRDCGASISARYPLVELGTGLAFAGITVWALERWGFPAELDSHALGAALASIAFLYLGAISIALALIDIDTHRLPNRIVLPAYAVGAVLLTGAAFALGDPAALGRAAIGMGGMLVLYLALALVRPGGMGLGDVKLAGVLGLFLGFLGWGELVVGAFAGFVFGGLFGLVLLVTRRAARGSGIPFGPWMVAGAWLGIVAGDAIAHGYLSLLGIA